MKNILPWNLIAAKVSGNLSQDQQKEFQSWMNESSDNIAIEEETNAIWNDFDKLITEEEFDTDAAWNKANKSLSPIKKSGQWARIAPVVKIAALVITFIGVGIAFYMNGDTQYDNSLASNNTIKEIVLKDGSIVKLNTESELKYPENFDGELRETFLKGEALFTIAKDKQHPFVINTGLMSIKVLGTVFNVKAHENIKQQIVSVLEGKVEVRSHSTDETIILVAGDEGLLDKKGKLTKINRQNINKLGWDTGTFLFEECLLPDALKEINEHYNVQIVIANDKLKNSKITAFYNNEKLENIIKILELNLNAQVTKQTNTTYVLE